MKNILLIVAFILFTLNSFAQSKNHKVGITLGAYIQHYKGNLGNSFFRFRTVCFGGGSANVGLYVNKYFDANVGVTAGDYGYCPTAADVSRNAGVEQQCPGCEDRLGMGALRARMVAGNAAIRFKFANGFLLKENAKLSPYIYAGIGINHLADRMKKQCLNAGYHFSINGGGGIQYNICDRVNVGYNVVWGCFMTKKVYAENAESGDSYSAEAVKLDKRKDLYMQNSLFMGINLF